MKNILISVLVAVAAAASGIIVNDVNNNTVNPSSPADVCVVSSVAPAVPEETTTNASVFGIVVTSAVCEPSIVPAVTTTNNTVSDNTDTFVSEIVIITENSVMPSVSAAVPETVNDAENNNDTIVSDNTDIQDETTNDINNTDMYNINNLYALTTRINCVDMVNDIVYCEDLNGFIWSFYGCEDWFVDDICDLLMYDNNTDIIYDDIILSVRYSGYIDNTDINNTVSGNIDSLENADIMPDNNNTDSLDTSENDMFLEYITLIENGDYIE